MKKKTNKQYLASIFMFLLIAAFIGVLVLFILSGTMSDYQFRHPNTTGFDNTVKVAVNSENEPLGFYSKSVFMGFQPELLYSVGEKISVNFEIVPVPEDDFDFSALEAYDCDLICGFTNDLLQISEEVCYTTSKIEGGAIYAKKTPENEKLIKDIDLIINGLKNVGDYDQIYKNWYEKYTRVKIFNSFFSSYGAFMAIIVVMAIALIAGAVLTNSYQKKDELRSKEESLRKGVERDSLTGLYNRNIAKDLIEAELFKVDKKEIPYMAFLMFDLDALKWINDSFGHDIGDFALKTFGTAVEDYFGPESITARIGGDEFICFLKNAQDERMLKARLASFIKYLENLATNKVSLRCSIGVAPVNETNRNFQTLYKQADTAMYIAKTNGKNGFSFYRKSFEKMSMKNNRRYSKYEDYEIGEYQRKTNFDYRDFFVWLLDKYPFMTPEQLILKNPRDFIMMIDPNTLEVVDVVATAQGKEDRLFEDFAGKKCYEALEGRSAKCEKCPLEYCNHKSYLISERHSEKLECDYLDRAILADIHNQTSMIHIFKEIKDSRSLKKAYQEATEGQNLVTECAYCDVNPMLEPEKFFEYQIRVISEFYEAEQGFILSIDSDIETVAYNIPDDRKPSFKIDMSKYAAEHWPDRFSQMLLIYVDDIRKLAVKDERAFRFAKEYGLKNFCFVPIWDGIKVYGYLFIGNIKKNQNELSILGTITGLLTEVMQHLNEKEENLNQKYFDGMTGSLNFEGFKYQLKQLELTASGMKYAICIWDIKKFKYLNEAYGFEAGDGLISEMNDNFARKLKPTEVFCHISADNFCALCNYDDEDEIRKRFESMAESLSTFFSMNYSARFVLELSFGIYLVNPNEEVTVDSMINMATIANKKAKSDMGTSVRFYDEEMKNASRREVLLLSEIEFAIRKKEFQVYLQPQVYIGKADDGKKYMRAEVLCRWIRDGKMYSSPSEFIPLFEENGKISVLDIYMLENACSVLNTIKESVDVKVRLAVNVSRLTLLRQNFLNEFDEITRAYGISSDELELEFTEGIAVTDFDKFFDVLSELKDRGCVCAMDDFGSDYSSLNVLQRLPIDVLKLDKKFFETSSDTKRLDTIIENTIKMAKELNMDTIAEGIEKESLVETLKNAKCDYIQGFVFAKPMPVDEYIKWLKKRNV